MALPRDAKDAHKSDVVLEEYATGIKVGIEGVVANHDGFGARKKVDPVEIKLVRKIDLYMMVREATYRTSGDSANVMIAYAMDDVLLQFPRS
jgi:hypothetical protein